MAKQSSGYMGGFSGKLGTAVGYMWRGKWCLRAHNPFPANPRTPRQVEHREMFKQEVQLAASMRAAVNKGFREVSYEMGMTPYNLFVHLNQHAFSLREGVFTVDYSALCLSTGPLTEAVYETPVWTADNVLTVNLARSVGRWNDYVRLYIYCAELEEGMLTAPVYRNAKKISAMLPTMFAGREVHVYGLVSNDDGLWAETTYVGCFVCSELNNNDLNDIGTTEHQMADSAEALSTQPLSAANHSGSSSIRSATKPPA